MKKKISLLLVVVLAMSTFMLSACGGGEEGGTDSQTIRMATGGTSGTYYAFGGVVGTELANAVEGTTFDVQSTGASLANIRLVAGGEVDMAIVQNDVMDYAYNGTNLFDGEAITGFSSMAACYAEVCQLVVAADSGINSVADLAGKNVSIGDAGSGVEFNARQILEAYGLTTDDIKVQNLGFGDSADAVKDGKIDAFFCTAGAPTTAIMELATTKGIKVIDITGAEAEKLIADYPFYTSYVIPAGTYSGQDADVTTVAVKATYIVSNDMSEDLVYSLTKALFESKDAITAGHAKGAELDTTYAVEGVSVPFHPGAQKYFEEIGVL